jgi:hypothetical protein
MEDHEWRAFKDIEYLKQKKKKGNRRRLKKCS